MDPTKSAILFLLSSALLAATAVHDTDTLQTHIVTVREPDRMEAAGEAVVEASLEKAYRLMTSRAQKLPSLHSGQCDGVWNMSNIGEGVVIGVLDDGIDAGHPSFGDDGMPPPPAKWRGRCKYPGATCNNKLIGARAFIRQDDGGLAGMHGTHASSVAAGAFVHRLDGAPCSVVSGVAPRAHLAFYQVCTAQGCSRNPIMHAVEMALSDGVDILSLSLGDDDGLGFDKDPVVAATFSAIMKGVFVCAAAGNNGPTPGTVTNDAPWILTVGASSQSSPQSITIPPFSSRGPSHKNGGVLKPDIVGPGVNILAAVPRSVRGPNFGSLSGTSMSAPHLSGIAALIKSAHPTWSPAAIKSAIMTTADTSDLHGTPITDETRRPASYFAVGAGHVNPAKTIDPGLVYDISAEEYVPYLRGLGYPDDQVNRIIYPAPAVNCAEMENTEAKDLNYPSITISLTGERPAVSARRTVTNVGAGNSVYRVLVRAPEGVSVTVNPRELQFHRVDQKASFTVTVKRAPGSASLSGILEGQLTWVSDKHVVSSPISISALF